MKKKKNKEKKKQLTDPKLYINLEKLKFYLQYTRTNAYFCSRFGHCVLKNTQNIP